jgi:hypothetical protein
MSQTRRYYWAVNAIRKARLKSVSARDRGSDYAVCLYCGKQITRGRLGRRSYCNESHKQAAYRLRLKARRELAEEY